MNGSIWRSTSMSAHISPSSVNAIVAVVIVEISLERVGGSHLNLVRGHDGHPDRESRRAASLSAAWAATARARGAAGTEPGDGSTIQARAIRR